MKIVNQSSLELKIENIIKEYSPMVSSISRRMIRNHDLAEEACQEVWLELVKSFNSFNGHSKISTWLYSIAKRTIWKYIRNEEKYTTRFLRQFFESQEDKGIDELNSLPSKDHVEWVVTQCDDCLTAILHCLDNESRLIYLFRIFSPLSYSELALVFDKTEANIRQVFSRSSRRINRFLNQQCYLYNPHGNCRCKIKEPIKYLKAKNKFHEIQTQVKRIHFIKKIEDFYSNPNYTKL